MDVTPVVITVHSKQTAQMADEIHTSAGADSGATFQSAGVLGCFLDRFTPGLTTWMRQNSLMAS